MSDSDTIKDQVLEYVEATDSVSFVELANRFSDHFKGGEYCIELLPNLLIWAGMSEAGSAAVQELLNEKAIRLRPSSLLVYLSDGAMLGFPIAKRAKAYAKPHWVPVTLRPAKRSGVG